MNTNSNSLLATFLVLAAVGCVTSSIKSTRDPTFTDKLHQIYVLINHGNLDQSYSEILQSALMTALSQRGVQCKIEIMSPLDLDESVYSDEIASYGPQAILTIVPTTYLSDAYGDHIIRIVYDASLFTAISEKRIWRAQVELSGYTMEKRMRRMADTILQQLVKDGLIEDVEPTVN